MPLIFSRLAAYSISHEQKEIGVMRAKRWIHGGMGFVIGMAVLASAVLMPFRKAEASDAAAAIFGGVAGLIIGTEMQRANEHQRRYQQQRCQQQKMTQRLLIREVLQKYHPDYHNQFIEYVMFDLQGYITPVQQRQVLNMLEQRHSAYYACCR
jgi:Na+/glutamate symporter